MKAKDFYHYLMTQPEESGICYLDRFDLLDCFSNDEQDMYKALDELQKDWTIHYYEPHEINSQSSFLIILFDKLDIDNLPVLPDFVMDNINNAFMELQEG